MFMLTLIHLGLISSLQQKPNCITKKGTHYGFKFTQLALSLVILLCPNQSFGIAVLLGEPTQI